MTIRRVKVTLMLDVSEPQETEQEGICLTHLTHPSLDGKFSFAHSSNAQREEVLKALDENLVAGILDVAQLLGGLLHVRKKNHPSVSGSRVRDVQE